MAIKRLKRMRNHPSIWDICTLHLLMPLLILSLLNFISCDYTSEIKQNEIDGKGIDKGEESKAITQAPAEFSSLAFLDSSLSIIETARLSTYSGQVFKRAKFYKGDDSALLLISPFAFGESVITEGRLIAVTLKEPFDTYELKDKRRVIELTVGDSPSEVYFNVIEARDKQGSIKDSAGDSSKSVSPNNKTEDATQSSSQNAQLISGGKAVNAQDGSEKTESKASNAEAKYETHLYQLDEEGKVKKLPVFNSLVIQSYKSGLLLLRHFNGLQLTGDGYQERSPISYSLTSSNDGKVLASFDYEPILSPSQKKSLRVIRKYNISDYSASEFSVYINDIQTNKKVEGSAKKSHQETELYTTSYYLTMEEDRWLPQVLFINDKSLLITTFTPEDASRKGKEQADEPYMKSLSLLSGKLNLEKLDIATKKKVPILKDISPYLNVNYSPGEPVFLVTYFTKESGDKVFKVEVVTIDGRKSRTIYSVKGPSSLSIEDVDYASGSLLILQSFSRGDERYSEVICLKLSKESRSKNKKDEPFEKPKRKREEAYPPGFDESQAEPPPINIPT